MSEECETNTEVLWEHLGDYLSNLPRTVKLLVYADLEGKWSEQEAVRLAGALSNTYDQILFEHRPRQPGYDFWPVIAVLGVNGTEEVDFGVRIIGLPQGVHITSLVGAVQAAAFKGQQLETRTRIHLSRLSDDIDIELVTNSQDEAGTVMAARCFSFAVANPHVRAFLIMADDFPSALDRHNVHSLPHIVLNNNVHIEGEVDDSSMLKHMAKAVARAGSG